MPKRMLLLLSGAAAIGLALGCQSNATSSAPPTLGSAPMAESTSPPDSKTGQLADPGLRYRQQQLKDAMRGLTYENDTVTMDVSVAATIASRGTRQAALAEITVASDALVLNDQHTAIAGYTKSIIIDPGISAAYEGLGLALYQRGKTREAAAAYFKAVELDSESISARLKLADALDRLKREDEAMSQWEAVLALDANNADAHGRLAIAYYMNENDAAAWAHTHEAERLGYEFPAAFRGLLAERTAESR